MNPVGQINTRVPQVPAPSPPLQGHKTRRLEVGPVSLRLDQIVVFDCDAKVEARSHWP